MKVKIYQIDAFTDKVFSGNPAAVCPLENWIEDAVMQNIASENNLAETAFFVKENSGYNIRWFTPVTEVELCGHATLASAYVIFNILNTATENITFSSLSGPLFVERDGKKIVLDFPSIPPESCDFPMKLVEALGAEPESVMSCNNYFVIYSSEEEIVSIEPDFKLLSELDLHAVIITAPGRDVDFVSRFFAPKFGIPEDPVTGSAHCTLIPYWADRLNKKRLKARQLSRRGGELFCEDLGKRVKISGYAMNYLEGIIEV